MISFYKNYLNIDLTWQECIDNLNQSVKLGEEVKFNQVGFYVAHSAIRIQSLKPLFDKVNCKFAHLYLSLTEVDQTFGPHKDPTDVWFWQGIGKTKWSALNKEYILEPGDLIYIPKGIEHNVTALTPRVGVSMANE